MTTTSISEKIYDKDIDVLNKRRKSMKMLLCIIAVLALMFALLALYVLVSLLICHRTVSHLGKTKYSRKEFIELGGIMEYDGVYENYITPRIGTHDVRLGFFDWCKLVGKTASEKEKAMKEEIAKERMEKQ